MVNDIFGGKPRSIPHPLQEHDVMTVVKVGTLLDWRSKENVVKPSTPGQIAQYITDREVKGIDAVAVPTPLASQVGHHLTTDGTSAKWSPDVTAYRPGDLIQTMSAATLMQDGGKIYLRSNGMEVLRCDGGTISAAEYPALEAFVPLQKIATGDTTPVAIPYPSNTFKPYGAAAAYYLPGNDYIWVLTSSGLETPNVIFELWKFHCRTRQMEFVQAVGETTVVMIGYSGGWLAVSEVNDLAAFMNGQAIRVGKISVPNYIVNHNIASYCELSCSSSIGYFVWGGQYLEIVSSTAPSVDSPFNNMHELHIPPGAITWDPATAYQVTFDYQIDCSRWAVMNSEDDPNIKYITSGKYYAAAWFDVKTSYTELNKLFFRTSGANAFLGRFNGLFTHEGTDSDGMFWSIYQENGVVSWTPTLSQFTSGAPKSEAGAFYTPGNIVLSISGSPTRNIYLSRDGFRQNFVNLGDIDLISPGIIFIEPTPELGARNIQPGMTPYGCLVCGRVDNTDISSPMIWVPFGETTGMVMPDIPNNYMITGNYRSVLLNITGVLATYKYIIANRSGNTRFNTYLGLTDEGELLRMNRGDPAASTTTRKLPGADTFTTKQPLIVSESYACIQTDLGAIYYSEDQLETNPILCAGSPNVPPAGGFARGDSFDPTFNPAVGGTPLALFAAASGDLYSSYNNFETSSIVATGLPFTHIYFLGSFIFAALGNAIYKTSNIALDNWAIVKTLPTGSIADFTMVDDYATVLTDTNELYYMFNGGTTVYKAADCPAGAIKAFVRPEVAYVFTATGVYYKRTINLATAGGWLRTNIPATTGYASGFVDWEGIITSIDSSTTPPTVTPELYWQKRVGV